MDNEILKVVPELLRSYSELGGLNKCDSKNLPSRSAVTQICEELLTILFPGFFYNDAVPASELEMRTMERVAAMSRELQKQIAKSFQCTTRSEADNCFQRVSEAVGTFFQQLPEVRRILKTDVEAAYDGDPAATSMEEIILAYPFIETIAIQRLAHVLYGEGVPIMPRMMTEWAHSKTGIDIHPGATIGSYFFIDHGTGVVIGETCVIGSHVKLYDGVTLGARSFPKDENGRIRKGNKRHPNVEDHVTVYANAIILGGRTTIGANSTIGANAFLTESVPPNSLVALTEPDHRISEKSQNAAEQATPNQSNRVYLPPSASEYPRSGLDGTLTAICKQLAEELNQSFLARSVRVIWNKRLSSTAGNASYQGALITLNPLLQDISVEEINRTLRHELAHLIAYARAGRRRIDPHGPEWRKACADLGIPEEARCHSLPLPRRRQRPKYAYQCPNCLEVLLRIRALKKYSACHECCRVYHRGRYSSRFAYEPIPLQLGLQLASGADDV